MINLEIIDETDKKLQLEDLTETGLNEIRLQAKMLIEAIDEEQGQRQNEETNY